MKSFVSHWKYPSFDALGYLDGFTRIIIGLTFWVEHIGRSHVVQLFSSRNQEFKLTINRFLAAIACCMKQKRIRIPVSNFYQLSLDHLALFLCIVAWKFDGAQVQQRTLDFVIKMFKSEYTDGLCIWANIFRSLHCERFIQFMSLRFENPYHAITYGVTKLSKCMTCNRKRKVFVSFYTCKGCKVMQYCSKKCQKIHWNKEHRKYCKTIKASQN